jgi:hypothetical protein
MGFILDPLEGSTVEHLGPTAWEDVLDKARDELSDLDTICMRRGNYLDADLFALVAAARKASGHARPAFCPRVRPIVAANAYGARSAVRTFAAALGLDPGAQGEIVIAVASSRPTSRSMASRDRAAAVEPPCFR